MAPFVLWSVWSKTFNYYLQTGTCKYYHWQMSWGKPGLSQGQKHSLALYECLVHWTPQAIPTEKSWGCEYQWAESWDWGMYQDGDVFRTEHEASEKQSIAFKTLSKFRQVHYYTIAEQGLRRSTFCTSMSISNLHFHFYSEYIFFNRNVYSACNHKA